MKNHKIVIFGETGFIGRNLKEYLSQKKDIKLVSVEGLDLLKIKKTESFLKKAKPSVIINLAFIGVNSGTKYSKKYLGDNLKIAENILKASVGIKELQKIIFLGSSLEYGDSRYPINEKSELNPKNPYAKVKSATILKSLGFAKKNRLPLMVLRPFNLYGPYDEKSVIYILIKNLLENKSIKLTKGEQIRDYLYIKDFAKIVYDIVRNLGKFENLEIYNVGSSIPVKLSDIFNEVFRHLNKKPKYEIISYRQNEYMSHVANTQKIKKIIRLSDLTPLSEGIRATVKWAIGQSN